MLAIASQIVLCLLLAALIGFIIGYLFCKMLHTPLACDNPAHTDAHEEEHTPAHTPQTESSHESAEDEGVMPSTLSEPRGGQKDNLTKIKGIGVKIEEELNKAGIYHFDQIAQWSEENIKWVDRNIGFPGRVQREGWIEQAKRLASGEETEFSKRVEAGEVSTSKKGS